MKGLGVVILATLGLMAGCSPDQSNQKNQNSVRTPQISLSPTTFTEGNDSDVDRNIDVKLSAASTENVTVYYTVTPITAEPGNDFVLASGSISIAAGLKSAKIPLTISSDFTIEESETFKLDLSSPQNVTFRETSVFVTIEDDDAQPDVSVLMPDSIRESTSTMSFSFSLKLSAPTGQDVGVELSIEHEGTDDKDIRLTQTSFLIPAGRTVQTFDALETLPDDLFEDSETFALKIVSATNAKISSTLAKASIADDDEEPKISLPSDPIEVSENAGRIEIPVTLDHLSNKSVTFEVDYSGTATYNTDFLPGNLSGAIEIPAGERTATLLIDILSDSLREGGETIVVKLKNSQNGTVDSSKSHTIIISSENQLNDTGVIRFSDTTYFDLTSSQDDFPGQDADYGRDTLVSVSSDEYQGGLPQSTYNGLAGFNFTKLDDAGNALPVGTSNWSCVRDNTTGIVYEHKQESENYIPVDPENLLSGYVLENNRYRAHEFSYTWLSEEGKNNGGKAGWKLGRNNSTLPANSPTLYGYCGYMKGFPSRSHPLYCSTSSYISELNFQGLCGYTDWKMPSVKELRSIVNYDMEIISQEQHVLDPAFFNCFSQDGEMSNCIGNPEFDSTMYWTSTPASGNPDSAWCLDSSDGSVKLCHKSSTQHILAVRSDSK